MYINLSTIVLSLKIPFVLNYRLKFFLPGRAKTIETSITGLKIHVVKVIRDKIILI